IFLRPHDLRDQGKFIKSELSATKKRGSASSPMKGQKPERGRSQGRGARHERSAAKRASILDGSPSGGYKRQHRLQRGAPLYCVDSTAGDVVQLVRTLPCRWLEPHTVTARLSLILNIIICFQ